MRRIIFSTGNLYKLYSDYNRQIEKSLSLDIDGIEILFAKATSLMKFRLSSSNKKKLRKLKLNTIHLPFYTSRKKKYIYFWNTTYCRRVLEKAVKIANEINAVNLNMHAHQLKNSRVLEGFEGISFTFENITERHGFRISDYRRLFGKHHSFGMLLDTSHAIRTKQLNALVKNFRHKIRFIHLSAVKGKKDDHYLVHRFDKWTRKRLGIIRKLKCPVIIEAGREKGLTMQDFRNEISYVRKWLS